MVSKLFASKKRVFLIRIFLTYIRPCLEYTSVVWSPSGVGLPNQLESVQRRFTRWLFESIIPLYEDHLREIGIPSLKARRQCADLIIVFKLLNHLIDIDPLSVGIKLSNNNTRSYGINLERCGMTSQLVAECYK